MCLPAERWAATAPLIDKSARTRRVAGRANAQSTVALTESSALPPVLLVSNSSHRTYSYYVRPAMPYNTTAIPPRKEVTGQTLLPRKSSS